MRHSRFLLSTAFFGTMLLLIGAGCLSGPNAVEQVQTTGPAGMFVTTDRGESWKQISVMPDVPETEGLSGVSVYRIFEDPSDPKTMYWASREHGLFYSYTDGTKWQQAEGPLATGFIYSVAVDPENKCTVYASNGRFVYKTTDCNRNWSEVYRETRSDVIISSLDINPFSPHQVYLAETNGDLFQSGDFGQSWNLVHRFKGRLEKIEADRFQDNVLYIATRDRGLGRSDDGGKTWIPLAEKMEAFSKADEYRRFFTHPTKAGMIYWISTYGILVSEDRGNTWKSMTLLTAPGSVQIYGFAINPKDPNQIYYTATTNGRSTFYRTVDGGQNWITKKLPSGQIPTAVRVHPVNGDWIYVGFTIPPKD